MFKYRLTKLKNSSRDYDGLWYPKAVHTRTMKTKKLLKDIPRQCTLKRGDILAVMTELSEYLIYHLQQGEIVELDGIGRFKLEVKGRGVTRPKDFDEKAGISGFVCHFTPFSHKGIKPLFKDIQLNKVRS